MANNTVVEARDLTMRFEGVVALDSVSLNLQRNELRCLIGPNGAGKSTFFKCLTGMQTPTSGEIFIDGENTTGLSPHQVARLGVGIKTQVPSVMSGLTVRENIWLAARRTNRSRAADRIVDDTLQRLELEEISRSEVSTLAHGQRQIVELGIVLAGEPWLVLLDEPAAGLTSDEVERMVSVIHEINKSATLIVVEHDMHFIRMIAKMVTVFHQGRVLIEEDAETVLNDPVVRDVYLGKRQ
ncbi:MAG: ATP-binding cassette domain-containing protein [Pseudomonadota bacterium]